MNRKRRPLLIAIGSATVAAMTMAPAVHAQQDKYALKSPSGIVFADFKGLRGLGRSVFRPHG